MHNDIDEPLGQDDPPSQSSKWRRPQAGVVLFTLGAVGLFSISTAIALRDRPFRTPPPAAIVEPQQSAREPDAAPPAPTGPARDRPSIIKVNPGTQTSGDNVVVVRDPSAVSRNPRLAHLPDRTLIEDTDTGPLPVRDAGGRRPFDAYAGSWSGARGARIAIIIGGLGISQTGTQEAIAELPSGITLAFAPLGNSLSRWMQEARREGHEVMLQVPLEPFDYPNVNPGEHTLLTEAEPDENLDNLHWVLSRMTNYTGVINYTGARFTADEAAMELLLGELGKRGLAYVDDGTSARSLAEEIARANDVPFAAGDAVIDARRERGAILEKLDELERIARARGFALGSGSALDVTVETVAAWATEARKRGIELVPMSAIANDPERN